MERYIDACKIKQAIKDYGKGCISNGFKTLDAVDDIIYIAGLVDFVATADVRKVIYCGECGYCIKQDENELWCTGFCSPARLVTETDFCSHAKKRDENDNEEQKYD